MSEGGKTPAGRESWNKRLFRLRGLLVLVQEVLSIQRISLRRTESRVANNPSQLFLGRAVRHAGCPHHILLEHHRADVVSAKPQPHLANLQSLRHPARLDVEEVRQ